MILLRLISWPYARKHLFRWVLTLSGIVLGVAVFVGMRTANESVLAAFQQTIDRIAGSTQLQVSAGEPGFDEDILERVLNVSEVRAAAPVIEAFVSARDVNLLILGVDMIGDRSLRTYDLEGTDDTVDDPLVFLAQPDSLIVTRAFAQQRHLQVNDRVSLRTMTGDVVFTVRGIMKPGGLATAFGGNLAVMDIYAAQKVLGRGRKFDRIDIALEDGVTLDAATAKLRTALGAGFQIEPPASRGQQFEATVQIYSMASNITSVFALFIGMFIIYNTFAIAVTQRRSEIGILRALGASRRQIRTVFLIEGAVSGVIGTTGGIVMGLLMARGLSTYISAILADIYGLTQAASTITIDTPLLVVAFILGIATSLIAAVVPARSAARTDPVKALQRGAYQSFQEAENRRRRWWALACALASTGTLRFGRYEALFYLGFVLAVTAAVLVAPALSLWVSRLLRPAMASMRPVEGTLAADSLIHAPRRTSGTVAALMLSLALVIALGGLARASYNSISDWIRVALDPDLFVTTAETITARSFVFPPTLGDGLRTVDGVGEVEPLRSVRILVDGAPILLVSTDGKGIGRRARMPIVAGRADAMVRATSRGEGLMASENFTRLRNIEFGQSIDIPTPSGTLRLPIVGIVRDFSDQQGTLLVSRDLYMKYWHDDTVNVFRIYLKPGASEPAVRQRILDEFGSRQRLFVLTNRDLRDFVIRLTDQWFALTYVQIAVAVFVAVLGIVNALTVSITDRRREIGVLRAVGSFRRQIRHTVWMEAVAIGVTGLILGLAFGAVQLYYSIEMARRDIIGVNLDYVYPIGTALLLVPTIVGAALLAALAPGESAVRGSLVEALEYE